MNVTFRKTKQSVAMDNKQNPAVCSLFEARASAVQEYSDEQQLRLKEGLIKYKPTSAFAQTLSNNSAEHMIATFFVAAPKGSILLYQSLEYKTEKTDRQTHTAKLSLPSRACWMMYHVY